MKRDYSTKISQELLSMGLSFNDLVNRVNKIASEKEVTISRATVYNIVNGTNRVREDNAVLILTAINQFRVERHIRNKVLKFEDLGIIIYHRWE